MRTQPGARISVAAALAAVLFAAAAARAEPLIDKGEDSPLGARGRHVIALCQQITRRKVAQTAGPVSFQFGRVVIYRINNVMRRVRGDGTVNGRFGRRGIRYECTVDAFRWRVSTATYSPIGGGFPLVRPPLSTRAAVRLCQAEIQRQVARGNAPPVTTSFAAATATPGIVRRVQGTGTIRGRFGLRRIRYNCSVNVQQGRVLSASYRPY